MDFAVEFKWKYVETSQSWIGVHLFPKSYFKHYVVCLWQNRYVGWAAVDCSWPGYFFV